VLLALSFYREGLYRKALAEIDALPASQKSKSIVHHLRDMFLPLSQNPDQTAARIQRTSLHYEIKQDPVFNWFLPVKIDGKSAKLLMDTGADISLISESEAKRLGLAFALGSSATKGAAGQSVTTELALAHHLAIGDCELQNVAFRVIGDRQPPFSLLAPGERGVLGIPVLLALETLSWDRNGSFAAAFPSAPCDLKTSNVCFEGPMPIAAAEFQSSRIMLELDTGAGSNYLYPRFAREFPGALGAAARKEPMEIGGIGGNVKDLDAWIIPELPIRIGNIEVYYRPAHILSKQIDGNSAKFHGLLGLPILSQAKRVTLDFRAMKLLLE